MPARAAVRVSLLAFRFFRGLSGFGSFLRFDLAVRQLVLAHVHGIYELGQSVDDESGAHEEHGVHVRRKGGHQHDDAQNGAGQRQRHDLRPILRTVAADREALRDARDPGKGHPGAEEQRDHGVHDLVVEHGETEQRRDHTFYQYGVGQAAHFSGDDVRAQDAQTRDQHDEPQDKGEPRKRVRIKGKCKGTCDGEQHAGYDNQDPHNRSFLKTK